jgi:hypothetical protein
VWKRGNRGADGSLKLAGACGEKERERGAARIKATQRKEGGRHRGPALIVTGGTCLMSCEQGQRRAQATHARVADRRCRVATGPGGHRWGAGGREQERGSGGGALTCGPGQHSAGLCGLK